MGLLTPSPLLYSLSAQRNKTKITYLIFSAIYGILTSVYEMVQSDTESERKKHLVIFRQAKGISQISAFKESSQCLICPK